MPALWKHWVVNSFHFVSKIWSAGTIRLTSWSFLSIGYRYLTDSVTTVLHIMILEFLLLLPKVHFNTLFSWNFFQVKHIIVNRKWFQCGSKMRQIHMEIRKKKSVVNLWEEKCHLISIVCSWQKNVTLK
jgi:hypothetical protein